MDYRAIVHLSPQDRCENRRSPEYHRSGSSQVIHSDLAGRTIGGERIPGAQIRSVAAKTPGTVKFASCGYSEYFEAAKAYLIVFGREWILVDEDLSNSLFCRQSLACREAINI